MEVTALCFRLLMLEFILLGTCTQEIDAVSLRITPDRLQYFEYESVSFHCDGTHGSTQLRRSRNTEVLNQCDMTETSSGSCYTFEGAYLTDSGEYWCETKGERSNSVNITITGGSVILESPALPVMEGEDVTLRCRNKTTPTNLKAIFYQDGKLIGNHTAKEMRINNVSKSNEGLYKCMIEGVGESPGSWLTVREPVSDDSTTLLTPLWIVVRIVALVLLVLVLLGFLHVRKHTDSSKTPTTGSHTVCGKDDADDPNGLTYVAVVTKPRRDKDAADAGDDLSLCTETNHSREPQTGNDEEEFSRQPVYSTVTIRQTSSALQPDYEFSCILRRMMNLTCFRSRIRIIQNHSVPEPHSRQRPRGGRFLFMCPELTKRVETPDKEGETDVLKNK